MLLSCICSLILYDLLCALYTVLTKFFVTLKREQDYDRISDLSDLSTPAFLRLDDYCALGGKHDRMKACRRDVEARRSSWIVQTLTAVRFYFREHRGEPGRLTPELPSVDCPKSATAIVHQPRRSQPTPLPRPAPRVTVRVQSALRRRRRLRVPTKSDDPPESRARQALTL